MKAHALAILILLPAAMGTQAAAAPVRVTLAASCIVTPLADGLFTLGSIATFHGGPAASIKRLAAVEVGRAPLPGDVRHLTPGDVLLKLRQAGMEPQRDVTVDGAQAIAITSTGSAPAAAPKATAGPAAKNAAATVPQPADPAPSDIVVKRGDEVVIVFQDGDLLITAQGVAQEPGTLGQEIRVRRFGMFSDLIAVVQDKHTVSLEL